MPHSAATIDLYVQPLHIPFRARFKHASAERKVSDSVWVVASRGGLRGLGEGAPRTYVTAETTPEAVQWIETRAREWVAAIPDLDALRAHVAAQHAEIDRHPAAWCAVETALLDLFAQEAGKTLEGLLGLPELHTLFRYSAVLGDDRGFKFGALTLLFLAHGLRDFKLKVTANQAHNLQRFRLFSGLTRWFPGIRVRVDANNAWGEDVPAALAALRELHAIVPLAGVEEPVTAFAASDMQTLSEALGVPVILDESFCRCEDLNRYPGNRERWVGNVRASKMGGILRSLQCVEALHQRGFGVVVGAQVGETSVLTRAALAVAQAAGPTLWAHEGAFGTLLLEREVVTPVLMFGPGGHLNSVGVAQRPGLGLREVSP